MYAKIYEQIFDSSIAEDWQVRHVFEDMIKLANRHGEVDMTHEAIARRTNVPLEIVKRAIAELENPDTRSRNPAKDGCRIERMDSHRDWGWRIVNHQFYRQLKTEEDKREAIAVRVAKHRKSKDVEEKSVTCVTERYPLHTASVSASASEGECEGGVRPPFLRQDFDAAARLGKYPDAIRDDCWDYLASHSWRWGNGQGVGSDPRAALSWWSKKQAERDKGGKTAAELAKEYKNRNQIADMMEGR